MSPHVNVSCYSLSCAGVAAAHALAHALLLTADIVNFTTMSKEVPPTAVMAYLNDLFTLMDELIDQYEVYKVGA